jgi:hypothetical protein
MEVERTPMEMSNVENIEVQQQSPSKSGRPPPIVLTSTTNLIQLQRQITKITTANFEFRNTRSGTRIVTKEMVVFQPSRNTWKKQTFPVISTSQSRKNQ